MPFFSARCLAGFYRPFTRHYTPNVSISTEHKQKGAAGRMKEYAKTFYKSITWQRTREAYASSKRYLCERCLAKGIQRYGDTVHHKTFITPENISDPDITLNWDNLQLLCRDCHADIHRGKKRYKADKEGRISIRE